jgi:hypothetical protein
MALAFESACLHCSGRVDGAPPLAHGAVRSCRLEAGWQVLEQGDEYQAYANAPRVRERIEEHGYRLKEPLLQSLETELKAL